MSSIQPARSSFSKEHPQPSRGRMYIVFLLVLFFHCALVIVPIYYFTLRHPHQKETMLRVRLGSTEMSHHRNIGKPERTPSRTIPSPPPPAPPPTEPGIDVARLKQLNEAKAKEVAKQKAYDEAQAIKRKALVDARKKAEQVAKQKAAEQVAKQKAYDEAQAIKRKALADARKKAEQSRQLQEAEAKRQRESVYNPDRSRSIDNLDNNPNPNVPVGSQNGGQEYGSPDNRTPKGSASLDIPDSYYSGLRQYFDARWQQPPRSLLGTSDPQVLVELTIDEFGRVLASRIVKASGNKSMDESVGWLLDNLDRVPRPPTKITIQLLLKVQ